MDTMRKTTRLQDIIASMNPERRKSFLRNSLCSGAYACSNCQGHNLERSSDVLLDETKSVKYQDKLDELRRLDGNPIYDLGCGSANGFSKVFRTYMPNSRLIGVDIDPQNKQIRQEILSQWKSLQDYAKALDEESYKRSLSQVEGIIFMMFHPESKRVPKYRETFELDEFLEGDFNNLHVADNSAGVIFTNLYGPSDIKQGTEMVGESFNIMNEIKRILIPNGIWVTSDVYTQPIEILYRKGNSDKCQPLSY